MMLDLLKEFVLELLRALFLEELSKRVKLRLAVGLHRRRLGRYQTLLRYLHLRHRNRLLHKITTDKDWKL